MILAAGRGERMRPLTDTVPKPLLKVRGKPLIVWHLEHLAKAGFKEIVINHAYLGTQIERALGNGNAWGVSIEYSAEDMALETAGGIANALHLLGDEAFLVVNSDIFTCFEFATLNITLSLSHIAHLVLVNNPPQHKDGDFVFENGLLKSGEGSKLTFSGIGIYHPSLFKVVVRGSSAKLAPLLRTAIDNNQVTAEHYQGIWCDIGTPQRLWNLETFLSRNTLFE